MPGNFEHSIALVEEALCVSREWLRVHTPERNTYTSVSATGLRQTRHAIGTWLSSGKQGAFPQIDAPGHRALIYSLGRAAADFQAYGAVCAWISLDLIDAALPALRSRTLAVALPLLRGLVERAAAAASLTRHVEPILEEGGGSDRMFEAVLKLGERVTLALFGTKIDWRCVSEGNIETASRKTAKYKSVEHSANFTARQVLDAIDDLDERVPGTRIAYEILCEFLHPNVGDLFSTMLDQRSFEDGFGTRHLEFTLGRGRGSLSNAIDVDFALGESMRILQNVIGLIPEIHTDLQRQVKLVGLRSRKSLHAQVKKNRRFFLNSDPCPCGSGKAIRACYRPPVSRA